MKGIYGNPKDHDQGRAIDHYPGYHRPTSMARQLSQEGYVAILTILYSFRRIG